MAPANREWSMEYNLALRAFERGGICGATLAAGLFLGRSNRHTSCGNHNHDWSERHIAEARSDASLMGGGMRAGGRDEEQQGQ